MEGDFFSYTYDEKFMLHILSLWKYDSVIFYILQFFSLRKHIKVYDWEFCSQISSVLVSFQTM